MKKIRGLVLVMYIITVFFLCSCGEKVIEEGKYSWVGEAFNEDGSVFAYVEKGKGIKNVGVLSSAGEFKSFGEFDFENVAEGYNENYGTLNYIQMYSGEGDSIDKKFMFPDGETYENVRHHYRYSYGRNRLEPFFTLERDGKYKVIDDAGKTIIESADEANYEKNMLSYRVGDKWGYIRKEIVYKPNYEEMKVGEYGGVSVKEDGKWIVVRGNISKLDFSFSDYRKVMILDEEKGFAKVMDKDWKWGIVNKDGEVILPCEYQEIQPALYDCFLVREKWRWGVVNNKGKVLIEPEYRVAGEFDWDKSIRLYKHHTEYEYYEDYYEGYYENQPGPEAVVYGKNKVFSSDEYDSIEYIKDDLFVVGKGTSWYILNVKTGERKKIEGSYANVEGVGEAEEVAEWEKEILGVIKRYISKAYDEYKGYGLADINGNIILDPIFEYAYFRNKNTIMVKQDDSWSIVNYMGKKKDGTYNYTEDVTRDGYKEVWSEYILDFSPEIEFSEYYEEIDEDMYLGGNKKDKLYFAINKGKKVQIVDSTGTVVSNIDNREGDTIYFLKTASGPFYTFSIEKYWDREAIGLVGSDGKVLLEPEYAAVDTKKWNNGNIVVLRLGSSYKKIYNAEKALLSEEYRDILYFSNDIANVNNLEGRSQLINLDDYSVIIEYDDIKSLSKEKPSYAIVKKEGKYGIYDVGTREVVLPIEYEYIKGFKNGNVAVKKDGLYEFIDLFK